MNQPAAPAESTPMTLQQRIESAMREAMLARDVRRFVDAGYRLSHIEAFDLFPNTAHVESVAVLDR